MSPNLFTSGDWGAMPPNGVPRGKAPWSTFLACLLLLVVIVPSARTAQPEAAISSSAGSPTAQVGKRFRDALSSGGEGPLMVVVPAGSFPMGSPSSEEGRSEDEGPLHQVTIGAPFAFGVYEVTVAEFRRFVDATSHRTDDACRWMELDMYQSRRPPDAASTPLGDSHPVVCVTWGDARSYAAWLSRETGETYRLPSEAEWEYVARAGTTMSRYWESSESGQCLYANGRDQQIGVGASASCDDGHWGRAPVGSFTANGWGLHDVLGNVWEWTADCWNESYAGAPGDGRAWQTGDCAMRVIRGGSWYDVPSSLRTAHRDGFPTNFPIYLNGFRVARTLAHDAHDLPLSDGAAPPPVVPLREKLGAHLLALSASYADGGSQAVQTYARSAGLNLPEQRVAVQVLAASEQDVAGLEQRIEEVGGSVQSTFENSIFATLPVPELGALASGEAVWRMDMQRTVLGPAEVVDLETEHGGRNAK